MRRSAGVGVHQHRLLDAQRLGDGRERLAIRTPTEVRLSADEEHDVALDALGPGDRESRLGPVDHAFTVIEPNGRAHGGEVEVAVHLDVRDRLGVPVVREVGNGGDGRTAIPSVECGDQERTPQRAKLAEDTNVRVHVSSSTNQLLPTSASLALSMGEC